MTDEMGAAYARDTETARLIHDARAALVAVRSRVVASGVSIDSVIVDLDLEVDRIVSRWG